MPFTYSFGLGATYNTPPELALIAADKASAPTVPRKIDSELTRFPPTLRVSASFLDFGPYATMGPANPTSPDHSAYLYLTYGDERGEAYAKSVETFMQGA
ncbi:MAG: hypothetical protein BJ554DRAFT_487, partial [Olpidium bornovanus]